MRNYRKIIVWGIMLAGFLAGILFVNLSGDTYLEKTVSGYGDCWKLHGKTNGK